MVLEALFNPFSVKRRPWEMFLAGLVYAFIGLAMSFFVFREIAGILSIFLIVIATLPLVYTTIRNEEELELKTDREWRLLKEHTKVIVFLLFLFLGITTAFVFSYTFLPSATVNTIFQLQQKSIQNVNNQIHSNVAENITSHATKFTFFTKIFTNNLKVLFFCLVFSLLYGTGAMFILTWNASVIATAIGSLIRSQLAQTTTAAGLVSFSSYFSVTTTSVLRYMFHGVLEIAAYFVMGLAGGILSIALIKHNLKEDRVLIDVLDLVFISLGLLVMAGIVEVYITPHLFT